MSPSILMWEELIPEGVKAGFTTAGEDRGFNLALHAGGDRQGALDNRKQLCRSLGLPFESYTCAEQIHGARVTPVGKAEEGRGRDSHDNALPATDALITAEPGLFLNIFVADCVPVILYDSRVKAGGLCHAGWRGTAELILYRTVEAMADNYGSRPEDIKAYIGPSVGGCCYEVGPHVKEGLDSSFSYERSPFQKREGHLFLDLKQANREQLKKAGLKAADILVSPHCTVCSEEHFFSYRKSGDAAGRFSAFFTIL